VIHVNIAIGLFEGETALNEAVQKVRLQGVSNHNLSLIRPHNLSDLRADEPVNINGFLEDDIESTGNLVTALKQYNLNLLEIVQYLRLVRKGYSLLLTRTNDLKLPWASEAMHRSQAVNVLERETAEELLPA
jgi:hypothetical protein